MDFILSSLFSKGKPPQKFPEPLENLWKIRS